MSNTIYWKDGDNRCHWCLREAISITEGHDGMCPVPYAAQLETENKRFREYIETYHDEDYVLWRREQDALLEGGER